MSELREPSPQPTVLPGQIWLIEQEAASSLTALARSALAGANVVLYDRALAAPVADALPLGSYAEPLPGDRGATNETIGPRALRFAADGWSVVQLVEARPGRHGQVQQLVDTRIAAVSRLPAAPTLAFTANGLAG